MNLSALIVYTRDLTGVYSTDVVPDTLVTRWLNEGYFEINRRVTWPWTATELTTGTDVPAFDAQFHGVLAYRAAIKLLNFVSDDTKRAEMYAAEYTALLNDLEKFYLPSAATGDSVDLQTMRRTVRDLTGMYSNQQLPDALIDTYLNNAYFELALRHDWDWLEENEVIPMPPAVDGQHDVLLGVESNRMLEAYLLFNSGEVREIVRHPNLDAIEKNASGAYYDFDDIGSTIYIRPVQSNVQSVKVRYLRRVARMVQDSDSPFNLDPRFTMILPYRASIMALSQWSPQDPRIPAYEAEFTALYQSMYSEYELSHDNRAFQLGEDGVQTRRYYPWFRPA